MQNNIFIQIEKDLHQIADMLLLNGTLTECPGLVHGKMGIAIFFFNYANYTKNMLFADYAMELISEILDQIHVNTSADYEKGIAGIGIGIHYLIQHNFLSIEDDICEDFDQRMKGAVMSDFSLDLSVYNGLIGYGRYWLKRLQYQMPAVQARQCLSRILALIEARLMDIQTMDQEEVFCFLVDLQRLLSTKKCINLLMQFQQRIDSQLLNPNRFFSRLGKSIVGNVARTFHNNRYFNTGNKFENQISIQQIFDLDMEQAPVATGLLNGYAGEGMLRLQLLDKSNNSWIYLL